MKSQPIRGRTKKVAPEGEAQIAPTKTKLASLVDLLRSPEGVSLERMMLSTGWQAHSVRGAIAGSIKKQLGHAVLSEKVDGVRTYRIVSEASRDD
jgi:hypothetical protein